MSISRPTYLPTTSCQYAFLGILHVHLLNISELFLLFWKISGTFISLQVIKDRDRNKKTTTTKTKTI